MLTEPDPELELDPEIIVNIPPRALLALLPAFIKIAPPDTADDAGVWPLLIVTAPPKPLLPTPTTMLIGPPLPPVAVPV